MNSTKETEEKTRREIAVSNEIIEEELQCYQEKDRKMWQKYAEKIEKEM